MSPLALLSLGLLALGACFFGVGAVGLMRLPDALSRLQAVSKASSLGLGLTVSGLLLQTGSVFAALKVLFVGGLVLVASVIQGQCVGRALAREPRRR